MGKVYIDTVKYIVRANVEIIGMVEKPDVVGAIFGQTEGLLGEELDLRELQKNGRIGRIEVNIQIRAGKSVGTIEVPSSLDIVETSIIGAALETVDRVGPCEARINVERIEDTRNVKRQHIISRAKDLVKKLLTTEIPERKEIAELVRSEVKTAEISTYGPERLPAGPNLDSQDTIIIVEGRADIINLLKNDINNVIAVGGATAATVPKTIIDLCRRKESTLFLDGDRGGDIILREITAVAEVDFVARAPPGKEVEELARKEIIKALRARIPIEQAEAGRGRKVPIARQESRQPEVMAQVPAPMEAFAEPEPSGIEKIRDTGGAKPEVPFPVSEMDPRIVDSLNEIEGTLKARIYDDNMMLLKEISIRDLMKEIPENAYAVVLDGIITQRLVDITESRNTKILAGIRTGNIFHKPERLIVWSKVRE